MDKRVVSLLTTIHDESMATKQGQKKGAPNGVQVIEKQYGIDEYNKYIGGIDKAGQLVQYYGFNNVSKKWWKSVFPYGCLYFVGKLGGDAKIPWRNGL